MAVKTIDRDNTF